MPKLIDALQPIRYTISRPPLVSVVEPASGIYGFREELNYRNFSYSINSDATVHFQKRWPDSLLIANRLEGESAGVSNHLRVAIERLNSSSDKKVPADQLLDYMIAMEALVSLERDAVSYRVALRIATLVVGMVVIGRRCLSS